MTAVDVIASSVCPIFFRTLEKAYLNKTLCEEITDSPLTFFGGSNLCQFVCRCTVSIDSLVGLFRAQIYDYLHLT